MEKKYYKHKLENLLVISKIGLLGGEIAEITGVSINTALGRMRYALINMRKNAQRYNLVRDLEKIF